MAGSKNTEKEKNGDSSSHGGEIESTENRTAEAEAAAASSEIEMKVAELQQKLECKESKAEELRQSIEEMIQEKGREMSLLITSADQIEDSQVQREKRISNIDDALKDLASEMDKMNSEKRECIQEREDANKDMKQIEKKRKKLESFLQSYTTETSAKLQKLQTEIDSLQERLKNPESAITAALPDAQNRASPELLDFIERQIKDAEKELECPVCFEIASQAPIFRCEEDHLICSKCREKVVCCPVCRVKYPRGARKRLRGAERQAERLNEMYKEMESLLQSQ